MREGGRERERKRERERDKEMYSTMNRTLPLQRLEAETVPLTVVCCGSWAGISRWTGDQRSAVHPWSRRCEEGGARTR